MLCLNQRRIQSWLDNWREDESVPGATLAVKIGDDPAIAFNSGSLDLDGVEPVTEEACFYLYSISKTYLAIITMGLVESKEIGLDDPILFLPDPLTVRQILNHTSGIPDYYELEAYWNDLKANPEEAWDDNKFINNTVNLPLDFKPGMGWNYSNTGYFHLRNIIEVKTGLSFQDLIFRFLIRPLNLVNTRIIQNPGSSFVSPGYCSFWNDSETLENIKDRYHPNWVGHRTVCSNALEVVKVFHALFSGQLISKSSLDAMLDLVPIKDRSVFPVVSPHSGLGILADLDAPHGICYDHGGSGPGYSTYVAHLPDYKHSPVYFCLLANCSNIDVRIGAYELIQLF